MLHNLLFYLDFNETLWTQWLNETGDLLKSHSALIYPNGIRLNPFILNKMLYLYNFNTKYIVYFAYAWPVGVKQFVAPGVESIQLRTERYRLLHALEQQPSRGRRLVRQRPESRAHQPAVLPQAEEAVPRRQPDQRGGWAALCSAVEHASSVHVGLHDQYHHFRPVAQHGTSQRGMPLPQQWSCNLFI